MVTGGTVWATLRTAPLPVYRLGVENSCPGCGKSNWIVGRSSAECAFCATALTIAAPFWTTVKLRAA